MSIERDVCKVLELNQNETSNRTPEEALEALYDMVTEFRSLLNCCSVDFIVDNLFTEALTPEIQEELAALDDQQVAGLPGQLLDPNFIGPGVALGWGWLLADQSIA